MLVDTCEDMSQLSSLRTILLGAEVVNPINLAAARLKLPRATIHNGYGPTEASVSLCSLCRAVPLTGVNLHDFWPREEKQVYRSHLWC